MNLQLLFLELARYRFAGNELVFYRQCSYSSTMKNGFMLCGLNKSILCVFSLLCIEFLVALGMIRVDNNDPRIVQGIDAGPGDHRFV